MASTLNELLINDYNNHQPPSPAHSSQQLLCESTKDYYVDNHQASFRAINENLLFIWTNFESSSRLPHAYQ